MYDLTAASMWTEASISFLPRNIATDFESTPLATIIILCFIVPVSALAADPPVVILGTDAESIKTAKSEH